MTSEPERLALHAGRRITALLIDVIVIWVALGLLALLIGYEQTVVVVDGRRVPPYFEIASAILIGAAYFGFFEGSDLQASPGKLAMRIRIVGDEGDAPRLKRALVRGLVKMATLAIPIFWPALLAPLFNGSRRAVHDMLAKCRVVGR